MNLWTHVLHLVSSGAVAYITARNIRDPLTRPNTLAGFQLAESGSVPFLEALRDRAAKEGDEWLAEKLDRHAADERRHGQIFAHALKQLNKQAIDIQSMRKTQSEKESKKSNRRSPFFAAFFEGYESAQLKPETIDWIVFMGSTYILERDASRDFTSMANALPEDEARSANLKKGMLAIANDEIGHAAYLYEALQRRLSPAEVDRVVDRWRERKVNAMLAMVGSFMQGKPQTSLVRDGAPTDIEETEERASELTVA
jgi:rubrerythrin